jgi:predicted nucleic acid-binding protein
VVVLDTNVISELMRPSPNPAVFAWVAAQPRTLLYKTHINQAEILFGIANMPQGARRERLVDAADAIFADDFAGRVLPFSALAARHYPGIVISYAATFTAASIAAPGACVKWHAELWPGPTARNTGSSTRQRSKANGHRV